MQEIFDTAKILKQTRVDFSLYEKVNEVLQECVEDAKFIYSFGPTSFLTLDFLQNLAMIEGRFDVISAPLFLHKMNNIEDYFKQVKGLLNENGFFIGTFFGLNNLRELGEVLAEEDIKICGQPLQRMLPLMDIKTIGMLLSKNGFKKVVVQSLELEFGEKTLPSALKFLRDIGEGNVLKIRDKTFFSGNVLKKYLEKYEKNIKVTFDVCFFSCFS